MGGGRDPRPRNAPDKGDEANALVAVVQELFVVDLLRWGEANGALDRISGRVEDDHILQEEMCSQRRQHKKIQQQGESEKI